MPVDSTTYWAPALPHLMLSGISLLEDGNDFPIDDKLSVLDLDCTMKLSVSEIILEHADHVVDGYECHNVHLARVESSPSNQAPHLSKTVCWTFILVISETHWLCRRCGGFCSTKKSREPDRSS